MIKKLLCTVFGHSEVGTDFNGWFCTFYQCRRCGHRRPAKMMEYDDD